MNKKIYFACRFGEKHCPRGGKTLATLHFPRFLFLLIIPTFVSDSGDQSPVFGVPDYRNGSNSETSHQSHSCSPLSRPATANGGSPSRLPLALPVRNTSL